TRCASSIFNSKTSSMAVLARQSLTDFQFQAFSIGNYVLKGRFGSLRFTDFQLLINYYFATDWYIIP
ncbi:MAG: hypothetical protein MJZ02_09935, partial [Paludibacteraceae bacterium]|nr:hypothetical protein [Paludibacteraceae bacterium]